MMYAFMFCYLKRGNFKFKSAYRHLHVSMLKKVRIFVLHVYILLSYMAECTIVFINYYNDYVKY